MSTTTFVALIVFTVVCWRSTSAEVEYAYACLAAVKVMDCWKEYHALPPCTGTSQMMTCAENEASTVRDCRHEKIRDAVDNMLEDFEVAEDAICENRKLKQEFVSNGYCWSQGRACALELVAQALSEETEEDNCDLKKAKMEICMNDVASKCRQMVKNYTDYIYQHSTCGSSNNAVLVSLMAAAVSLVKVFSMIFV